MPFAIYVATSFADRVGELWWLALEAVIAQNELIGLRIDGRDRWFEARSVPEKRAVYDHIYAWLRQLPTEDDAAPRDARTHHAASRRHGRVLPRAVHGLAASLRRSPPIRW